MAHFCRTTVAGAVRFSNEPLHVVISVATTMSRDGRRLTTAVSLKASTVDGDSSTTRDAIRQGFTTHRTVVTVRTTVKDTKQARDNGSTTTCVAIEVGRFMAMDARYGSSTVAVFLTVGTVCSEATTCDTTGKAASLVTPRVPATVESTQHGGTSKIGALRVIVFIALAKRDLTSEQRSHPRHTAAREDGWVTKRTMDVISDEDAVTSSISDRITRLAFPEVADLYLKTCERTDYMCGRTQRRTGKATP